MDCRSGESERCADVLSFSKLDARAHVSELLAAVNCGWLVCVPSDAFVMCVGISGCARQVVPEPGGGVLPLAGVVLGALSNVHDLPIVEHLLLILDGVGLPGALLERVLRAGEVAQARPHLDVGGRLVDPFVACACPVTVGSLRQLVLLQVLAGPALWLLEGWTELYAGRWRGECPLFAA